MLHPARLLTALVVLLVALAVRGAVPDGEEASLSPPQVAQHNQPLAEQLGLRWRQLPDVLDAHAGYRGPASGSGSGGVVTAYAVCTACDLAALQQRLARDIWTSQLLRLDRFRVSVAHDDRRDRPQVATWDVAGDAAELYDRYGNGLVDPDKVGSGS